MEQNLTELPRLGTGVPGLDAVLAGGLVVGDAYLVLGLPGTGKTTLGNQLAYARAVAGDNVVYATLLTETHDRMLAHLRGFRFFDPGVVGTRLRYLSLLRVLREEGLDGVLEAMRHAVRDHGASLLIVDGTSAAEELAPSRFDYSRFVQELQARSALLGCTTVLLVGDTAEELAAEARHVDGVLQLANERVHARDVRWLRVTKLRGSDYLNGQHQFAITDAGLDIYPRLEAAVLGTAPPTPRGDRLAVGVPALDAMLDGGLLPNTSTMVLGTPGAGKTVLGLHFVAEGARHGEPGLIASFHETLPSLVDTAQGLGQELEPHVESGLVRVLWRPPLELSPDAWAWDLLAAVAEHRPRRLVVDALSDLVRLFAVSERQAAFAQALTNELRARGLTMLFNVEIDSFVGPGLAPPIPAVSATMDNGLLLRTVELNSRLHRLLSILKTRQSAFDPTIRQFVIGSRGIEIGESFGETAALLTGTADPAPGTA